MKELKELFGKILNHLGIVGKETEDITKTFFNQVYAIFIEDVLKKELPKETFDRRIKEYQVYIKEGKHELVHKDVKHYIKKDSGKLFAKAFLKHLKFFVYGLKEKGDVTQEQIKQIGDILKNHIQGKQALDKMKNKEKGKEALNTLAS
ncbi:hypothetical protein GF362_01575 [Candidatus Dojkabacteria bacterium]|nr:hypothetical protein [Candidatus Dojkabacteria bacterium]